MINGCEIESIGRYLPELTLTTKEIVADIKIPMIKKLELLTGIKERRICDKGDDSFTLGVKAARDCLKYSEYKQDEIDLIISCSITKYKNGLKHHYEPSLASLIKQEIGAKNALCFDISNACAGMLSGLYIADTYISSGQVRNCLLVSGEYISSLMKNDLAGIRSPTSKGVASLTLGDAGSAVLLKKANDPEYAIKQHNFVTYEEYNKLCVGKQSQKDAGATMKTNTRKIHEASIKHSYPLVMDTLDKMNLKLNDFDYLIPHQTSKSAIRDGIRYFANKLGKFELEVIENLEYLGNTASTTHFLALYDNLLNKRFKRDDRIMLICLASGLVMGITVFKMNGIVERYGN